MKINEIRIQNFRQYKDIKLRFPSAAQYDLNYVLAENGIGKTTLLNSITWCLYGKELHVTQALKEKTLPLLTLKTLRDMKEGEEADTSVTISLEEAGGEISFTRTYTYRKTEEGQAYEKVKSQKVIITPEGASPEVLSTEEEFNVEVNKRLPFKIQQFFFFDGEQLDTYLANTTGENVERTILEISQIDLLVTMGKNLDIISTEMRRAASKSSSKAEEINVKYEKQKEKVQDLRIKLEREKKGLAEAKFNLQEINSELGDDPDISILEKEREDIDKVFKDLKKAKADNTYNIKAFLKRYLTLLTALPRLKELYDLIKEKEKHKELPPKYDKEELQEMIDSCHCNVCGRDLDTDAKMHILEFIKRYELGQETGALLSRLPGTLQMLIKEAERYEKERDRLFKEKERIEADLGEKADRLRVLDSVIDKYTDKDHIIALYDKRAKLEKYIDDTYKQSIRDEVDLENEEEIEKSLKKDLDEALKKDTANKKLQREKDLAERARDKVETIISEIKGGIRSKISEEMRNRFFELMWKKKFTNVELTESYSASVINEDGFECLGSCSAAERELLVLAFTLALHKESGFDGPLVIDTPIARISGELRVAFAKILRTVSERKQIILFVTEDEYSTNVRDVFEPYANKKYTFELVDEDYVKVGEK